MKVQTAIAAVEEFFEGEYHHVMAVKQFDSEARKKLGQRQDDCKSFHHCYVDQDGGGMTGDDFHGKVYFNIEKNDYLVVEY